MRIARACLQNAFALSAGQNGRRLRYSSVTYFAAIRSFLTPRPRPFWLAHPGKAILKTRPSALFLLGWLATSCSAGEARSVELGFGAASFGNGASVRIATKAEPPRDPTSGGVVNGYAVDYSALHRSLVDHAHSVYFGYDIYVEPVENGKKCRVTISALSSAKFEKAAGTPSRTTVSASAGGAASLKIPTDYRGIALPKYPEPQLLKPGDTLALDLLVSPDGQQKITDYITVAIKDTGSVPQTPSVPDFALEDVAMRIQDPLLFLNGSPAIEFGPAGEFVGHYFWFSVPGKGRFIVSPTPNPGQGFEKNGTVRGNVLRLRYEGADYEIRSRTVILGSEPGQGWNLYVLRDPAFRSTSGTCGSGMRVEQLSITQ